MMQSQRPAAIEAFQGVFSLLLTPFLTTGEIDWTAYDRYVDWQLSHEPQGLFAVCGSSEMKWLSLEERLALARRAVARAGRRPVLATANLEADPATHQDEIAQMAGAGVAAVVLVPPDGLGREPQQLHDYLARLADGAPCPVILYEWPQVQAYEIAASSYGSLVAEHGVYGIKDTTCTLEGIGAKIAAAPDSIVYQANTPFLLESLRMGARGILAITSAAAADKVVQLWHLAGQHEEAAKAIHQQLVALNAVLGMGYPATAKYLAGLRGVPMETHCRWPVSLHAQAAKAVSVWWEMAVRLASTGWLEKAEELTAKNAKNS